MFNLVRSTKSKKLTIIKRLYRKIVRSVLLLLLFFVAYCLESKFQKRTFMLKQHSNRLCSFENFGCGFTV